jgi:hypothetical protein
MQVHIGLHAQLEEAANELIRRSLEGVTSMSEKSDILTPWKEMDRRRREVYNVEGKPDGSLRRGMYHRAWNSRHRHLNSVEGKVPVFHDPDAGVIGVRFSRDTAEDGVLVGEVYDLRVGRGRQQRTKCPGCSKFVKGALEVRCRCGAILSRMPEDGHYQIVRLAA